MSRIESKNDILEQLSTTLLVLLMTVGHGCAKKESSVSPENFCAAFVEAACAWQDRCAPIDGDDACEGYRKSCTDALEPKILAAIRRDEFDYDEKVAASWLAKLRGSDCSSDAIVLPPEPLFRPRTALENPSPP